MLHTVENPMGHYVLPFYDIFMSRISSHSMDHISRRTVRSRELYGKNSLYRKIIFHTILYSRDWYSRMIMICFYSTGMYHTKHHAIYYLLHALCVMARTPHFMGQEHHQVLGVKLNILHFRC